MVSEKWGAQQCCFWGHRSTKKRSLLKWLLLAYLVTKLSSPMTSNLLFAKFWL